MTPPSVLDPWGQGRGVIRRATPVVRLLAGATIFAACLLQRPGDPAGFAFIVGACAGWLAVTRPPLRLLKGWLIWGLLLFSPVFLLTPLLESEAAPWRCNGLPGIGIAWDMFVRGMAGLLAASATACSLSRAEAPLALRRLPLPDVVAAVALQVLHQAGHLVEETSRIMQAVRVRGAAGGGFRNGIELAAAVSRSWLPRVLFRAERVALAMEMRGFSTAVPESGLDEEVDASLADVAMVASCLLVLTVAVLARGGLL